jgi:hypothetical protein
MYRSWKSRAPDVVDNLVAYLQAAIVGVADVDIQDGPWVSMNTANNMIVIGWAGFPVGATRPAMAMQEELGDADITSTGEQQGLGPSILETMSIMCAALGRDGSNNMSTARRNAYNNLAICGGLIEARQGLAGQQIGGVMQAIMGTVVGLHQSQDRRGALAVVTFDIQVRDYAQQ